MRDAGEEAWLGREAPEDPELDGPEESLLALPSSSGAGVALGACLNDSRVVTAGASTGPAAGAVGFGACSRCQMPAHMHSSNFPECASASRLLLCVHLQNIHAYVIGTGCLQQRRALAFGHCTRQ